MPPALKVKQFGLPRWIWLVAITGGVGVGLYIRSRRAEADSSGDPAAVGADPTATDTATDTGGDLGGSPVGFYDATSGASLPDVAGADTVEPFDVGGLLAGLAGLGIGADDGSGSAGTPGPRGKKGAPGTPGKRGKPGKAGHKPKGTQKKPPHMGGGGPPKRPAPKVQAKPKPSAPKPKPKAGKKK